MRGFVERKGHGGYLKLCFGDLVNRKYDRLSRLHRGVFFGERGVLKRTADRNVEFFCRPAFLFFLREEEVKYQNFFASKRGRNMAPTVTKCAGLLGDPCGVLVTSTAAATAGFQRSTISTIIPRISRPTEPRLPARIP